MRHKIFSLRWYCHLVFKSSLFHRLIRIKEKKNDFLLGPQYFLHFIFFSIFLIFLKFLFFSLSVQMNCNNSIYIATETFKKFKSSELCANCRLHRTLLLRRRSRDSQIYVLFFFFNFLLKFSSTHLAHVKVFFSRASERDLWYDTFRVLLIL